MPTPQYSEDLPKLSKLVSDLDDFDGLKSFKKFGFGIGGPHHEWVQKLFKLMDDNADRVRDGGADYGYDLVYLLGVHLLMPKPNKNSIEETKRLIKQVESGEFVRRPDVVYRSGEMQNGA